MDHTNIMTLKNNFLSISDSYASIFLNFFGKAIGLVTIIFLAGKLDQNSFGMYSYLIALSGFIAVFLKLGLPPYLTKLTSSLLANQSYSKIKSLWKKVNNFLLYTLILILILSSAIYFFNFKLLQNFNLLDLSICLLIAFSISLNEIRSSMIRGMGHIKSGLIPENFIRPILFIICLYFAFNLNNFNLTLILIIFLLAYISSNIVNQFIIFKINKNEIVKSNTDVLKNFDIKSSEIISYFFFTFLQVLMAQFCILLFPFFSTYEELALFRIAFSGGFLLTTVLLAIASANINKFAGLYSTKDFRKLEKFANKCSKMSLIYSLLLISISCVLASFVIDLLLGELYLGSLLPFYIIAVGQLFNCSFGLASSILQMSKFQFFNNISLAVSIGVGIILFILLVQNYGAIGASIAYSSSLITYVFLSQFFCKLKIGFIVNPFQKISKI